jgi:hypothetical protein
VLLSIVYTLRQSLFGLVILGVMGAEFGQVGPPWFNKSGNERTFVHLHS